MAKLEVGRGFFANFSTTPLATASGDILVANSDLIRIDAQDGIESFFGSFTYNQQGLPLGTILKYTLVPQGNTKYTISNANIDVLELRETAASGDPENFLKLIFRGNDSVIGAGLDDKMAGYRGNDVLKGRSGNDSLKGVDGSDTIFGGPGNDFLMGGSDRDVLYGGTGADWLNGGSDRNWLTGGEGDDTFVFAARGQPNTITDFEEGDQIALGFSGLGPGGVLDPAYFHVGAKAENRQQKILYDSDEGWLLYAKYGSATRQPEKFAKIYEGLGLGADDFLVI